MVIIRQDVRYHPEQHHPTVILNKAKPPPCHPEQNEATPCHPEQSEITTLSS
ncbi:MAG: hypothetical protein JXR70_06805 [Spirochaetales bacterium]|nr:hypothetical protein [Spirochaetales bacterium]